MVGYKRIASMLISYLIASGSKTAMELGVSMSLEIVKALGSVSFGQMWL